MTNSIHAQIEALRTQRLPIIQARFAEVVGETTRCPNKTYLLRRIETALTEAQTAMEEASINMPEEETEQATSTETATEELIEEPQLTEELEPAAMEADLEEEAIEEIKEPTTAIESCTTNADPEPTTDEDDLALNVIADTNPEVTDDEDDLALDVIADADSEVTDDPEVATDGDDLALDATTDGDDLALNATTDGDPEVTANADFDATADEDDLALNVTDDTDPNATTDENELALDITADADPDDIDQISTAEATSEDEEESTTDTDEISTAEGTPMEEPTAEPAPLRTRDMNVDELRDHYLEIVGRPTRSRHRAYLIWKIRQAERGKIHVGPVQGRASNDASEEQKVIPLRMPVDTVTAIDEVRRRQGLKSRMDLFRLALHTYFIATGELDAAARFRPRDV